MTSENEPELKAIRRRLNMNQQEFARALGRSYQSVQQYETGRQVPNKVLALARALANVPARLLRAKHIIEQAAHTMLEEVLEGNAYAGEQLTRLAGEIQQHATSALTYKEGPGVPASFSEQDAESFPAEPASVDTGTAEVKTPREREKMLEDKVDKLIAVQQGLVQAIHGLIEELRRPPPLARAD